MKCSSTCITIEPDDIKRETFTLVNSSDLENYKDDHYNWSMKVSGSVEHINMLGDGGVICYGGNIGSIDVRNGRLNISHNATVSNIRELGGWVSYDGISTIHFMTSVLQGSIVTTPFTIHHVTTFKDCEILNEGTVYEYGVLKDSHIGKNGYVLAKAHSIIDSVVVSDGGHLFAEDRAHLKNIYIAKGGSISICPGTHTRHVTACTGSIVYVNPEVKEKSLKLINMEEGVEVKTTDNKTKTTDNKTDVIDDQSDVYLTLYTTTNKVEDFEFEYLLVHILNHNYKLYCKMDWWNGDSKPCKLEQPYKFMNPLDPRDKATFEYRGLLHLKDCYLVDAETDMSVGDLDFLTKADILGMTYRSTKDFRCLIDKNGALFRQKNLYVCDEPLCYECLGDPKCKPVDDPAVVKYFVPSGLKELKEKQEKYDWQKTPQELSEQYPDNLILGGYSANNVCTLREIYLEYNRFGYDKPIKCHVGIKNAIVNFNPETNCMTVRLIDWGLWNPEDQSVFEHDCILDSIKITGWGYDHDTKGFYVPHFSEAWYNGKQVNMAEKTENIRITNFQDYVPLLSTSNKLIEASKKISENNKQRMTRAIETKLEELDNKTSDGYLTLHCRTNYPNSSFISWLELEFPTDDYKSDKSIYTAFWDKPEISYNPEVNIYTFIYKNWTLRQINITGNKMIKELSKDLIKKAKITHVSFHNELPKNFQFDILDVMYDCKKIDGPPFVNYGIWDVMDNPRTTPSKGSIQIYDPNIDENLPSSKKQDRVYSDTFNWHTKPEEPIVTKDPEHKETVYKKIVTCDIYPYKNLQVRDLSEKEIQTEAFEDKSPKHDYLPVSFCTDLIIDGSTASRVTVLDGGFVHLKSGYIDDVWVYPGGMVRIDSKECYGNVYECGGYLDFDGDEQNTVNSNECFNLTLNNKLVTVHKGTKFYNVVIRDGTVLYIRGKVKGLQSFREPTDGNRIEVMNDGVLESASVEAGTTITAYGGSILENVTVVRGGVLELFNGVKVKHLNICYGGILRIASNVSQEQKDKWLNTNGSPEIFMHLGSRLETLNIGGEELFE